MKRIIIIALAIIGISQGMMAQERRMTLDEILKLAMERNLGLQSSRMAVERASALQGTAFSPDPTSISLSQDPTSGGSPDNAITVSQNIALPSVYSAHKSLLKAQTNVERSRLAVDENELRREVSNAFYDLLYAHDVLNIYSRQSSIYNDFNRVAVAKFSAGETGRLERMNAERLKRENEIKSKNAKRDFRTAQLNLMKWLNADTLIIPIDSIEDKSVFPSNPYIESPLLMLAKADVDVANRQLKLEKKGYLPTFSFGASVQAVIKGFNPYNVDRRAYSKGDFMGFSVGVNIPLAFGAQKARMNAARKTVDMASLNVRNQEYMLRKAYEAAYNDYLSAHNSLEYYQTQGVSQAREMERISKISYENGSIGYVELMQNMQSAVDVWKEYADAECRYNKTIVELNYLKGDNK